MFKENVDFYVFFQYTSNWKYFKYLKFRNAFSYSVPFKSTNDNALGKWLVFFLKKLFIWKNISQDKLLLIYICIWVGGFYLTKGPRDNYRGRGLNGKVLRSKKLLNTYLTSEVGFNSGYLNKDDNCRHWATDNK